MLSQLSIQNFAIIKQTTIDFKDGLTIITGATGAGKSIVIDAISQLLGSRSNASMVGLHQDYAYIEGVFNVNDHINSILSSSNIICDDEYFIISKTIKKDGKSQLKINNRIITSETIRKIAPNLVEIHSQDATYQLKDTKEQLSLVDLMFNKNEKDTLLEYQTIYKEYLQTLDKKNDLLNKELDEDLLSFYEDQLNDINNKLLSEDKVIELEHEEASFKEFVNIDNNLKTIINSLKYKDTLDNINTASLVLDKLSLINDKYSKYSSSLNSLYYSLDELIKELVNEKDLLYYDEDELNEISEHLFNHNSLLKRYSYSYDEVLKKQDELINKVNFINNGDALIKALDNKIDEYLVTMNSLCLKINKARIVYAKQLENNVVKHLNDLYLKDAAFKISLNECSYNKNGNTNIEFMFNANAGGMLQSLNKVASGGELARLMLALKIVMQDNPDKLLIFDEVDTGVSGQVADAIGLKIKEVSTKYNVIAITHLFQVACYATNHLYIEKQNDNNITTSNTYYLNKEQQLNEIAKMLSGNKISATALEHAKELLHYE